MGPGPCEQVKEKNRQHESRDEKSAVVASQKGEPGQNRTTGNSQGWCQSRCQENHEGSQADHEKQHVGDGLGRERGENGTRNKQYLCAESHRTATQLAEERESEEAGKGRADH